MLWIQACEPASIISPIRSRLYGVFEVFVASAGLVLPVAAVAETGPAPGVDGVGQAPSRTRKRGLFHNGRIPFRGGAWTEAKRRDVASVVGRATSGGVATLPTTSNPDGAIAAGPVMAIGGAEDKLRDKLILSAFVNLAGGPDARIAILPTASSIEDAGERYKAIFLGMGAQRADILFLPDRAAAASGESVELLDGVTGVFMTGGNQMRLASIVAGTPVARKVKARNQAGAVVAGTSAGASILSSHMVAYGASGPSPRMRMAQMTAGFDLVPGVVIDQHFRQRDRIGRLLALVAGSPGLLGIGVDEDTAALFHGDMLEILGRHSVTIIDGTHIVSDIHRVKAYGSITVSGAIIHVLAAGNRFDMVERKLLPNERASREVEKSRSRERSRVVSRES